MPAIDYYYSKRSIKILADKFYNTIDQIINRSKYNQYCISPLTTDFKPDIKITQMKRINRTICLIIVLVTMTFLSNCTKDDSKSQDTIQNVKGYAQKGPFINGSSVTVFDLQTNLAPTGKTFNAQITDNKGTFELNNIALSSNYVRLRADGFYYNEITGKQSLAQITLYALSDISGKSNININLLTNLEKPRVEYLMKNGKSFADSKVQAQKEILALFNIQKSTIKTSEVMNIAESGDDNGILLAVTSILQGFRSESELTELMANIGEDISTDGVLNSDALGSALINDAVHLDTTAIKNNLTNRYNAIGAQANIPKFGKYIPNFISQTKYKIISSLITYPLTGINGNNILALTETNFTSDLNTSLSLAALIPKVGSLKIQITALSSDTTYVNPNDTVPGHIITHPALWYYSVGSGINWSVSPFDVNTNTQTFTAIEAGKACDLSMRFDKGEFRIAYFEMNPNKQTKEKMITVK
jgi:hypothetical protein